MENIKNYKKYFILLFILLVLLLVYLIIRPFLVLILSGAVLAYIFFPIYRVSKKIFRQDTISALVVSVVILILILIPSVFVVISLGEQVENFYQGTISNLESGTSICEESGGICSFLHVLDEPEIRSYLSADQIFGKVSSWLVDWVTKFLLGIPGLLLDFIVIMFVMFYFFKDGEKFVKFLTDNIKIKKQKKNLLVTRIRNVVDSIVFGNIIMAIIQGTLGTIGFWILGIDSPLLWGLLMAFFSLIPFVGTAAIWLPAAIILMIAGNWIKALILILYGFLIIGGVDTLMKPILIGDKANIHPIIILVGVLGGIPMFGMMGIILGPLILGIAITLFNTFVSDNK